MMSLNSPSDPRFDTRISMLDRLRRNGADDPAWQEFVAHYSNLLKTWCRQWGVGNSDIDDVIQETLLAVVASLPNFEHRGTGSFRGWMKTIARRCFAQLVKHYVRNPVSGATALDDGQVACENLVSWFEKEAHRELVVMAFQSVKQRVHSVTWNAFELSAVEGLPGSEVAQRLSIPVANVYVARGRVQRMISEEIAQLDGED